MVAKQERQQEWQESVAQWQASGLSQRAFALEHGFSQKQISYWSRLLASLPQFVPVHFAAADESGEISLRSAHGWTLTLPRDVSSSRRRTRIKVVCWDGTGVWMCLRRLHRVQFIWPAAGESSWQVSAEQRQWLIAGVDWQRLSPPAPAQWRL